MTLAKIPKHFLESIEIDAILLTKLRENKWDKIHEELLRERPVLNLQTSYEYEHCFDFNLEFYYADRLPKLELIPNRENDIINFNDYDFYEILYNILML
tara:strand:- start:663 stop:959 length:297 start_codon:yes stop_codon:yes gene_type:complete